MCSSIDGHVSVKFGDGPVQRFSCSGTSDGQTNTVFLEPARKFISAAQHAPAMIVEAEFYREGRRQLRFDARGLNWR
jgi:hypothetical protein